MTNHDLLECRGWKPASYRDINGWQNLTLPGLMINPFGDLFIVARPSGEVLGIFRDDAAAAIAFCEHIAPLGDWTAVDEWPTGVSGDQLRQIAREAQQC